MLSAYITHPNSLLHEMGPDHPEGPARVSAVNDYLLAQGLLDFMVPYTAPAATRAQIERVHTSLHIAEFEASAPASGYLRIDPDTLLNPHTVEAARHAAGAAVLATELVARGEVATAFCNVRPAGHHATRSAGMGFCFFNNVAVGIAHALAECGMERVALVDFDAHHGNGSEDIFAGDERVLMVSTFERGLYPCNGEEPTGPNLCNVPLERYSRGDALRDAVTSDFRLVSRRMVNVFRQVREPHRFIRGLVPWIGFRSTPFLYDRHVRHAGTKYPFSKMFRFATDAILSFSNVPLRISTYIGLGLTCLSAVGILIMLYAKFFTTMSVPGITAVVCLILGIGGVQFVISGLLGEYIGRIFEQGKARPIYIVASTSNLDA
jgi:hypothetical protein